MTINSSGPISLAGTTAGQSVEIELGGSGSSTISMNDSNVRTLNGATSGAISMSGFYGRAYYPTWNTAAGGIGSGYTQQAVSFSVNASSGTSTTTYAVVSGSLPGGLSLNSGNGVINGTISAGVVSDYSSSTFGFTIRAYSSGGGFVDRSFSIFVQSRYVGYQCFTTNEGGTLSGTAPSGYVYNRVVFSSYGTPNGSCNAFSYGGCNSISSNNYNPTPTTSFSIGANNSTWGDPCPGTAKRMYLELSYGPF